MFQTLAEPHFPPCSDPLNVWTDTRTDCCCWKRDISCLSSIFIVTNVKWWCLAHYCAGEIRSGRNNCRGFLQVCAQKANYCNYWRFLLHHQALEIWILVWLIILPCPLRSTHGIQYFSIIKVVFRSTFPCDVHTIATLLLWKATTPIWDSVCVKPATNRPAVYRCSSHFTF